LSQYSQLRQVVQFWDRIIRSWNSIRCCWCFCSVFIAHDLRMLLVNPDSYVGRGAQFAKALEGFSDGLGGLGTWGTITPPVPSLLAGEAFMLKADPFVELTQPAVVADPDARRAPLLAVLVIDHAVHPEQLHLWELLFASN